MKKFARILFLSSFATLPLFALDGKAETAENPEKTKEVTLEDQKDQEVTIEDIKEAEEAKDAIEVTFADDKKDELNSFAFSDKKDEAKEEQKEDSLFV